MDDMTFDDVKGYFGTVEAARSALGLRSRQTLYNWQHKGIPFEQQFRIQLKTRGRLKADFPRAA